MDASALVSVIAQESSSRMVFRMISGSGSPPVISDFARAESSAAFAKLVRTGARSEDGARILFIRLDRWALEAGEIATVASSDIALASEFVRRHHLALRAPDAIHIAAAHRLGATLLTLDKGMARAAAALGVPYLNPAEAEAPGVPKD